MAENIIYHGICWIFDYHWRNEFVLSIVCLFCFFIVSGKEEGCLTNKEHFSYLPPFECIESFKSTSGSNKIPEFSENWIGRRGFIECHQDLLESFKQCCVKKLTRWFRGPQKHNYIEIRRIEQEDIFRSFQQYFCGRLVDCQEMRGSQFEQIIWPFVNIFFENFSYVLDQ